MDRSLEATRRELQADARELEAMDKQTRDEIRALEATERKIQDNEAARAANATKKMALEAARARVGELRASNAVRVANYSALADDGRAAAPARAALGAGHARKKTVLGSKTKTAVATKGQSYRRMATNVYRFTVNDRYVFRWKKGREGVLFESALPGFATFEAAVASMNAVFASDMVHGWPPDTTVRVKC